MFTTIHNYTFGIDTSDWSDKPSGERAAAELEKIVMAFSAQEAKELHGLLQSASAGDIEWTHPKLEELEHRCLAVAEKIVDGWAEYPTTGHNCHIYAVASDRAA